jgi:hypothetical protein
MAYCRQYEKGSGAISVTLDPGRAFQLEELRFHYSAAAANESFTVTLDSGEGSEWDVVVVSQSVNGLTDYVKEFTRPRPFANGDKLKIAQANANLVVWGLEIIWQPL